ncbi:MAG: transporter [Flavobacterium sp.]
MSHKVVIISFLLLSQKIFAQISPLEADRPDQTETPALVPKKYFQFETGFIYEKDRIDQVETKNFTYPTILAKYGVNNKFELRLIISNSYSKIKEQSKQTKLSGISPVEIGFKTRLMEEKGIIPLTSVIMHIVIPKIASKDFKAYHLSTNFRFTMQHTLSEKISLGYNLGAEWDGISPDATGTYTLTTGFKFSEKFGAYIELFGFLPEETEASHSFDGGISFLPKKNLMLDISAGFGVNKTAPDYFVGCGFSLRLPN